jgi:hypothetical protein
VVVSVKRWRDQGARQVLVADVELKREGQELTVFRFSLDEHGDLVPGSVYDLHKPLRTWRP